MTHTLSHFRGEEPPKSAICPLCDQFTYTCDSGWESWNYRQNHVAIHHSLGETLRLSRPDFHLFQHLWQKRLIDDQDLKELKGGNHNLTRPPANFTVTNGRRSRDGRRRHQPISCRLQAFRAEHRTPRESRQYTSIPTVTEPIDCSEISAREIESQHIGTTIVGSGFAAGGANSFPNQVEHGRILKMSHEGMIHALDRLNSQQKDYRSPANVQPEPVQLSVCSENEQESDCISDSLRCDSDNILSSEPIHLRICPDDQVSDCLSDSPRSNSDIVEDTGSSDGAMEKPLDIVIPRSTKEHYLTQLLQSFHTNRQWSFTECTSGQDDGKRLGNAGSGKHRASSPPQTDGARPQSSKRNRRKRFDDGDRENEDDEIQRAAPGGTPPGSGDKSPVKERLFACPFVKRYPKRYLKCFSHTLKDISRVKQHLFRDKSHRLPIYCPNCSGTFDNELLRDEHIRDVQCVKRPVVKREGITEFQRRQLSKRSPSTRTPEANWFAIFEILFPGDILPIDPYIDAAFSGELRAFREHLLVEGPRIWNDVLTTQLPEHLRQYVEELQSLYDSFYVESITRLCESWHAQSSADYANGTQIEPENGSVSASPLFTNTQMTPNRSERMHTEFPTVVVSSNIPQQPSILPEHRQSTPNSEQILDVTDNMDPASILEEPLYLTHAVDKANSLTVGETSSDVPQLRASSLEIPHPEFHHRDLSRLDLLDFSLRDSSVLDNPQSYTGPSKMRIYSTYPSIDEPAMFSSEHPEIHDDSQDAFAFLDFDGC